MLIKQFDNESDQELDGERKQYRKMTNEGLWGSLIDSEFPLAVIIILSIAVPLV